MVSRRRFIGVTGAAMAAAVTAAAAQQASQMPQSATSPLYGQGPQAAVEANKHVPRPADHSGLNETIQAAGNGPLAAENFDSEWPPETDNGAVPPFWYSFELTHKRITAGGWTRQVTERELPISKTIAGVQMHLEAGAIRELHWHLSSEWSLMLAGNARITCIDDHGRSVVSDVKEGDLWLFPGGFPHSIQALGPIGCEFLLVFNQGSFDEDDTFLLTDWMVHVPKEVLAKNFSVPESTFDNLPKGDLYMFPSELPGPLAEDQAYCAQVTGKVPNRFDFFASEMQPTKTQPGGNVKIIDRKNFPATDIAAAVVTLKPGGLRELHWHPNADEWQYYVAGQGRMGVFEASKKARTMDFKAGDVGYIKQTMPHYIENTGDTDVVFLEMFATPEYEDVSLAEWLAHTPPLLANEHIGVGQAMLKAIPKRELLVTGQ